MLTAITFQVCSKLVVAGLFSINRQELTALFCINKQNPTAHCEGKCYMVKQMKETDTETQPGSSLPVKNKTTVEEVWICEKNTLDFSSDVYTTLFSAISFNGYLSLKPSGIFQPPRA